MRRRLTISIDVDLHDEVRNRVPDGEVSAWFAEAARRMLSAEDDARLRRAARDVDPDDDLDDLEALGERAAADDAAPAERAPHTRVPWSVLRAEPGTGGNP